MIREDGNALVFDVQVVPRASREKLSLLGDRIKVQLTAPPVDGAANDALVTLLAHAFAIPRRAVRILAGESSRAKLVELEGVTPEAVRRLAD